MASTTEQPAVQHIVNLVVRDPAGRFLLARYDSAEESEGEGSVDTKWWLPAQELEAYQHPDEAADLAIGAIGGLDAVVVGLQRVQSFRGRRGWHISFDYLVEATGEPSSSGVPAAWHTLDEFPPTMHGNWERTTIEGVLAELDR